MTNQELCHKFGHPAEMIKLVMRKGSRRIYRCEAYGQTSASRKLRIRDWKDEETNDAVVLQHVERELEE